MAADRPTRLLLTVLATMFLQRWGPESNPLWQLGLARLLESRPAPLQQARSVAVDQLLPGSTGADRGLTGRS
jgi:hypothetical protein